MPGNQVIVPQSVVVAETFNIIISANTSNYNLRTAVDGLGYSGLAPAIVTVTINAGVVVNGSSTSAYGFRTGAFISGSLLTLTNLGRVQGRGGDGAVGSGGNAFPGNPGAAGGPALLLEADLSIDNAGGQIWSGGGGGGSGGGGNGTTNGGSGGGGGAGTAGGARGEPGCLAGDPGSVCGSTPGVAGTATAGGAGGVTGSGNNPPSTGNGGDGGAGGNPGVNGTVGGVSGTIPGGAGGATGNAINRNGWTYINLGTGDIRGPIVG